MLLGRNGTYHALNNDRASVLIDILHQLIHAERPTRFGFGGNCHGQCCSTNILFPCKKGLLRTGKLPPKVTSVIESRDETLIYDREIKLLYFISFDHDIQHPIISVMLKRELFSRSVNINHEVPSRVLNHPLGHIAVDDPDRSFGSGDPIEFDCDPIILKKDWDDIRARAASAKKRTGPKVKDERFILDGLLRCGICGTKVRGRTYQKRDSNFTPVTGMSVGRKRGKQTVERKSVRSHASTQKWRRNLFSAILLASFSGDLMTLICKTQTLRTEIQLSSLGTGKSRKNLSRGGSRILSRS